MRRAFGVATVALIATVPFGVAAQWQGYKTPRIPRTADGKANLTAPTPKTADGKPDLNGIWLASRAVFDLRQTVKEIPLSAEGKAIFDQRQATLSKDDPSARCLPTGLPVRALLRTPFKILQAPGTTAILYESGTRFRQVLTDGRPLPELIDWPAWQGFSIGRWEGDTFVITTGGFNGKAWLDQAGHPQTPRAHLTERYTRTDSLTLKYEVTIDDPGAYSKPWTTSNTVSWRPGFQLMEFICQENEKDSVHMTKERL